LVTTFVLTLWVYEINFFQIPHTSKNLLHLLFCTWFISLSIIPTLLSILLWISEFPSSKSLCSIPLHIYIYLFIYIYTYILHCTFIPLCIFFTHSFINDTESASKFWLLWTMLKWM
jgi:hypothetical protein